MKGTQMRPYRTFILIPSGSQKVLMGDLSVVLLATQRGESCKSLDSPSGAKKKVEFGVGSGLCFF